VEAVTDDAGNDGRFERRRTFQRDAEQFGELGEVGDAGEDIDQQHFDAAPADPAQHLDESRGVSAQKPGADIAEVERLAATRRHLVDQHHRQSGAGGEQADLAFRIDLDVIEAVAQLAHRVWIDFGRRLDLPDDLRLALRGVEVDHELGVAGDAVVCANEQRIDLGEDQLSIEKQASQLIADIEQRWLGGEFAQRRAARARNGQ
jgi:hypothetical protein